MTTDAPSFKFTDLRDGQFKIFKRMLHSSIEERKQYLQTQPTDLYIANKAKELEEACCRHILGELIEEPPSSSRKAYVRHCGLIRRILTLPKGDFLQWNLGVELLSGETKPTEAVSEDYLMGCADGPESDPRKIVRALFYKCYSRDARFQGRIEDYAVRSERSCFNAFIARCIAEDAEEAYVRDWTSQEFKEAYSARCGTVLANIAPESIISQRYGGYAIDNLANQTWSPDDLGNMASTDLCPNASIKERAEIEIRSSQTVTEKTSNLYRCPNCRARECSYREVQTRGLDESATICCTCQQCGFQFNG